MENIIKKKIYKNLWINFIILMVLENLNINTFTNRIIYKYYFII